MRPQRALSEAIRVGPIHSMESLEFLKGANSGEYGGARNYYDLITIVLRFSKVSRLLGAS